MRRPTSLALLLTGTIAIATGRAHPASADTAKPATCVLPQYTIAAVEPHLEVVYVKVNARRVRGAEIFVAAEPGLTTEWLRLQIDRHRGAPHAPSRNCVLDVGGTDVSVDSRGAGFVVTVS